MQGLPKGIRALPSGAYLVRVKSREGDARRQVATLAEAEAMLKELRAARGPRTRRPKVARVTLPDVAPPIPASGPGTLRWADAIAAFLDSRRALGRRSATVESYERALLKLARAFGVKAPTPAELSEADLMTFATERLKKLSVAAHHHDMSALRAFLRWCELPIGQKVPVPSLPAGNPEVISEEDLQRLCEEADRHPDAGIRALIWTAACTAVRHGEAMRLRVRDLDLTARTLTVPPEASKNPKVRRVLGVSDELAERLAPLLTLKGAPRDPDALLFGTSLLMFQETSRQKAIRGVYNRAGVSTRKTMHALRSTRGTIALREGLDFASTVYVMGWSPLSGFANANRYLQAGQKASHDALAKRRILKG